MIRFATIGTNFVTTWFLEAAGQCEELQYAAVYSRTAEKTRQFAEQYGAAKQYTDLNALAADQDIDAVYIASPNALHCEQAKLMLGSGKHVLCEKPVASNLPELRQMLQTAAAHGVVLLEAMRSAFDPGLAAIRDNLPKLGRIRNVCFQYCQYSSRYDKFKAGIVENAFNPLYSNGALMDIGVYCVHPLVQLFGRPRKLQAEAVILDNGVDGAGTILAGYDGMLAELVYSKIANSRLPSQIQGENGCMIIREIASPDEVTILYNDQTEEKIVARARQSNMIYEVREWLRLIRAGADATPYNSNSLLALEVMDQARQQMGIRFPADRESA